VNQTVMAFSFITFACLLAIGAQFLQIRNLLRKIQEAQNGSFGFWEQSGTQALQIERYQTRLQEVTDELNRTKMKLAFAENQITYLRCLVTNYESAETRVAIAVKNVFSQLQYVDGNSNPAKKV
jgi:hypothetical protein